MVYKLVDGLLTGYQFWGHLQAISIFIVHYDIDHIELRLFRHTVLFCLILNSWCWMQRIKCLRIKPFGQSTTEKYVMCFLMNRG